MQRPEFGDIKDYEEFSRYYWYREELIGICKAHGLKSDGSKIELNQVIQAYFSGEMIRPEKKKVRKKKAAVSELKLDTGLIECGFTFGNRFRDFFSEQTGISPFKFNVDMVATAKSVKENVPGINRVLFDYTPKQWAVNRLGILNKELHFISV